jgi:hypothetical protein
VLTISDPSAKQASGRQGDEACWPSSIVGATPSCLLRLCGGDQEAALHITMTDKADSLGIELFWARAKHILPCFLGQATNDKWEEVIVVDMRM